MAFKIKVAKSAGFCFGVRKALDRLLEIRNKTKTPIRTLGQLIHNEQVLEALKKREVHELQENESVAGKHVIIRAHGVSPDKRKQLLEQRALVCDATCPKVGQIQAIVKKYARKNCPVIIIGDRGHAEVEGLLGYSAGLGIVVAGPQEALELQGGHEVCVVAQTTQDLLVFQQTLEIIKQKFTTCYEFNTICDATSERQTETRDLAKESDIMVIVGGKNSANTRRLVDIAEKYCKTMMVQCAENLDADAFQNVRKVGVTAGASTPASLIRDVVEEIRLIGWKQAGTLPFLFYKSLICFTRLPFSWAIGFAFLSSSLSYTLTGKIPWFIAIFVGAMIWVWKFWGKRANPGLDVGFSAFVAVVSTIPIHGQVSKWALAPGLFFLGITCLHRLLLFDALHVQADRISGQPTIPAIINEEKLQIVFSITIGLSITSILLLMLIVRASLIGLFVFIPMGFAGFLHQKQKNPRWCDVIDIIQIDAPIWIISILVILIRQLGA